MTRLLADAWNLLTRGMRTGNAALTAAGAALVALRWIRRTSRGRELLWAKNLKPGDGYRIRLVDPDGEIGDEVVVDGQPSR
ncbi:MAG: hypothetical protein R3290_05530 [Acidimicrobiia bacterium]|nr:hypothetical protein [Acidimicrobiia bacterium]